MTLARGMVLLPSNRTKRTVRDAFVRASGGGLLLPRLVGGYSGVMVEKAGYAQFFLATALLGIPTLLLIVLQWGREHRERNNAAPAASEAPK